VIARAMSSGYTDRVLPMVQFLIEHGADVTAADTMVCTARPHFVVCCRSGCGVRRASPISQEPLKREMWPL
jgi:hypothetical protein